MKKTLVVYYSKTGNTKKIAEKISEILKADIDEVYQEGTEIKFKKNPRDYDLIIVGTPVWAWNPTPMIKEYLKKNKNEIKEIAFFCTYTGIYGWTLNKMKKLSKKPIAVLKVNKNGVNFPDSKIKDFCEKLK